MIKIRNIHKSIFVKLLLSFLVLSMLPTVIVWGVFIYFAAGYETTTVNNFKNLTQNIATEFDKNIMDIQGILNNFSNSTNIFDEISSLPYSSDSRVKDILRYNLNKNKNIENIIVINNNGYWETVSRENKFLNSFYNFRDEAWFEKITNEDNEIQITGLHSQNYFNGIYNYVFSFSKKYYKSGKLEGIMVIDVSIDYFVNAYNMSGIKKSSGFQILDKDNFCVYSNRYREVDSKITLDNIKVFDISQNNSDIMSDGNQFYITAKSDITGWNAYIKFNKNDIFEDINNIKAVLYVSNLIIIFLIIVLSIGSAFAMFSPIKVIMDKLSRIKCGDFNIKNGVKSDDELGRISAAIDDMALSLREHIDKEYFYQIKQKEAELNALKMQIRPHFLYNTLEIIRMTAKEEKAKKTSLMVTSLAEQLRYLLGTQNELVKLNDEVEMLKNYLDLVKLRYKNIINVIFNVDEETLDCLMQKIILQPIVENSIKHAITDDETELAITVSSHMTENEVIITIYDNGCGMSEDKLKSVFSQNSDTTKHIGLKSINDRIKLLYGEPFGIQIESSVGMGTLVKITIPKIFDRGHLS